MKTEMKSKLPAANGNTPLPLHTDV